MGVDLHRCPQVLVAGSLRCSFGLDAASVWFAAASRVFAATTPAPFRAPAPPVLLVLRL
jgi:hypothetical protein